jgi:zinc-binding alcohol dehydrogenase family protein
MRAVGYQQSLPVEDPLSLQDVELPDPVPGPRDLLVEVKAVSANPVDTKQRKRSEPPEGQWAILGYDAVGVVREVGSEVALFAPGDRVWYAGSIKRQGTDAQLHVVDERIVSRAPQSLDDASAAALPLTAITAYELLFDRVGVPRKGEPAAESETLLVVGAGGGVGSILVQLARQLTDVTVVGTASRQETTDWVRHLGAHEVIDHSRPLAEQIRAAGLPASRYVISLTHTDRHFDQIAELIAPQGRFGLIDDPPPAALNISKLKGKSVSVHWESMFTRSTFETPDMIAQHRLLAEVAGLIDAGTLKTTLGEHYGAINAVNLRRAHATLESGRSRGKIVLEGF